LLHGTIEKLQKNLEAKDMENKTLGKERDELKVKGRGIVEKFKANTADLKEKEQEVKRLKQHLTEAQGSASGYLK
jgi:SMC interacting uncharacterized protein involved in chromosome segregation